METRWLYTTSENFAALRDASEKTCVIPMGCIEKHGLHLPLGTDIVKGSYIAHRASQIETVCVFPDFTFGDTPRGPHAKRPDGSVCLDVRLQMLLLEKLCDEIAENGFNKILVANSHGGNNSWLAAFARNWNVKPHKAVFAWTKVDITFAPHRMGEILLKNGQGAIPELTAEDEALILQYHKADMLLGHACMGETALVMAAAPESVRLDRLGVESGKEQNIAEVQSLIDAGVNIADNGWEYNFPNWYAGDDPIGINERIAEAAARLTSEKLAKAYRAYKKDEYLLKKTKESYYDKRGIGVMDYRFLRFPGGKVKAVTLSYDDGLREDMRFSDKITECGLKATFNLNREGLRENHITAEEVKKYILDRGHEVALHGSVHRAPGSMRPVEGIRDILECRLEWEKKLGIIIRGMAYPDSGITYFENGASYESIKRYLTELDIAYARSLRGDNKDFHLPTDWHNWIPTTRHANPELTEYIDAFFDDEKNRIRNSRGGPRLFYLWGHSNEFERYTGWELLDEICGKLSGRDDVWYATNMEIYEYVNAYHSLIYSADGKIIYNPTLFEIWFVIDGEMHKISPGGTLYL